MSRQSKGTLTTAAQVAKKNEGGVSLLGVEMTVSLHELVFCFLFHSYVFVCAVLCAVLCCLGVGGFSLHSSCLGHCEAFQASESYIVSVINTYNGAR